jgi:hypothetical protein
MTISCLSSGLVSWPEPNCLTNRLTLIEFRFDDGVMVVDHQHAFLDSARGRSDRIRGECGESVPELVNSLTVALHEARVAVDALAASFSHGGIAPAKATDSLIRLEVATAASCRSRCRVFWSLE